MADTNTETLELLNTIAPAHYSDALHIRLLAGMMIERGYSVVNAIDCSGDLGLRFTVRGSNSTLDWIRVHCDGLRGVMTQTHTGGNAAQLWTAVAKRLTYTQIADEIEARLDAKAAARVA